MVDMFELSETTFKLKIVFENIMIISFSYFHTNRTSLLDNDKTKQRGYL